MNDTASPRQLAISCTLMLFAIKLLTFPAILFDGLKTDGLITLGLLLLADLGILILILQIKKRFPNSDCFEILTKIFGKVITKIIVVLLATFCIFKLLYVLVESFGFLRGSLFDEATLYIFLFCLLPVITSLASSNFRAFMRTAEFFFVFIMFAIIFCISLSFVQIDEMVMQPLFDTPVLFYLKNSFSRLMWFGDYLFVFLIMDKIEKNNKKLIKTVLKYTIFGIILIFAVYFSYLRLFRNTSAMHSGAILEIIQFSTRIGNVGKIDIIPICVILFIIFFQGGLYFLCTKKCLDNIFKKSIINTFLLNIILIVCLIAYVTNVDVCIKLFSNYFCYLSLLVAYILPITVYAVTYKKRGYKK